jgi:hypothetical protein
MHPQGRVLWQHWSLLDYQLSLLILIIRIPNWLELIQTCRLKPCLLPIIECKMLTMEMILHTLDKVI